MAASSSVTVALMKHHQPPIDRPPPDLPAHPDSRMSPNLLRGMGKSIGEDLDIDDKGSEQHRFEPVQSLHHSSVGYQPVLTRIGLAKKVMSLQVN
jgi:hypothetical protein